MSFLRFTSTLLAVAIGLAAGYAAAAIGGMVPLTWPIFAWLLIVLTGLNLMLIEVVRARWSEHSARVRVKSLLWLTMSFWYWTIAPLVFFLIMNVDDRQLKWAAFAFIWEVPVIGGGVFVLLATRLMRPVFRYLDEGKVPADLVRLRRQAMRYPFAIAALLFVVSMLGYGLGTAQIALFADWPRAEQVKGMAQGAVVTLYLCVFLYAILDAHLGQVRKRLWDKLSGSKRYARRTLRRRLIGMTAIAMVSGASLIGLSLYRVVQPVLAGRVLLLDVIQSQAMAYLAGGIMLAMALTLGLIIFISHAVTRALKALTKMAQNPGSVPEHFSVLQTGDEIEVLAEAFAKQLRNLLRQKDVFQEQMVRRQAILNSMGEGLVVTDAGGRVKLMNRRAEELVGVPFSKARDQLWTLVARTGDEKGKLIASEDSPLWRVLTLGGAVNDRSLTYQRKGGRRFSVAVTMQELELGERRVGAVVVFQDITREKAIEEAKTEFVSLASHQMRTPLTAINWYVELLKKSAGLSPEGRKDLQKISQRSQAMVRLVNDLLNVSRLDTGQLRVNPIPTDLAGLIQRVIDSLAQLAQARGCRTIFHKSEEQFDKVALDPGLLEQVIHNLVENAIAYSRQGSDSRVWVQLERGKGGSWLISVQDNGIGIPKEKQERVFAKFFRSDNAIRKETEGTGLGLYLAKMILVQAGAKIWFESVEGRGTTFFVEIPAGGMRDRVKVALRIDAGNTEIYEQG